MYSKKLFYSLLKNKEIYLEFQQPVEKLWKRYVYVIKDEKVHMVCFDDKENKLYESRTSIKAVITLSKKFKAVPESKFTNLKEQNDPNFYAVASRPSKKLEVRQDMITFDEVIS